MIKKQYGSSLIEAVVSLFVFSIGILGIAALQTTTLVRGGDVKQRSVAIWKAQELADRIRSTRTIENPGGRVADFRAVIGSNTAAIDSFTTRSPYRCPADGAAPQRCDDSSSDAANSCSVEQSIAADVWTVLCEADTGASDESLDGSGGINRLKGLDVALTQGTVVGENFLYFSWLSQSAFNNEDIQAATPQTVTTELCGQERSVDSRLDTYCLRFF